MSTDSLVYETFDQATPHHSTGPYTADDYLSLPEGERVELLRGRFIMMSPAPKARHQFISMKLALLFDGIAGQQGGIALPAPIDVQLNERTILQPDVVYVRSDRLSIVHDRVMGAPDLLVEVLSPSTANRDRVEKLDLYAEAGVAEYWIVDPETHVFEFHILDGTTYRKTAKDSDEYHSPQFAEVQLDLSAFWEAIEKRLPRN